MTFADPIALGRSGLQVGRLGLASSYGAPAAAFEEAFERGCNYFVWGSFIRGRRPAMRDAVQAIVRRGQRERMVLAMHSYWHSALLMPGSVQRALKALHTDHLDVLILGYYPRRPSRAVLQAALKLRQAGLIRCIGLSGHNRGLFPELASETNSPIDVFHVRYNAAHRGAEQEIVAPLQGLESRPGFVAFTATRWGRLLDPGRMPPGESAPSAVDCYRFVLSRPGVDVCLTGPRSLEQMRQNLRLLDQGPMDEAELARMRRIGDHVYGRKGAE